MLVTAMAMFIVAAILSTILIGELIILPKKKFLDDNPKRAHGRESNDCCATGKCEADCWDCD